MICFRLLDLSDPTETLAQAVSTLREGRAAHSTFEINPSSFRQVPNAPFCYWVSEQIRRLFVEHPLFDGDERTVKQGLATADDFRFVRTAWETPHENSGSHIDWIPFAKGGSYREYYTDIPLKVLWRNRGSEIKNNLNSRGGIRSNVWMLKETESKYFFKPGLTWPRRSARMRSAPIPAGCIFSHAGMMAFTTKTSDLPFMLGLMSSLPFDVLCRIRTGSHGGSQFEVGIIRNTPIPDSRSVDLAELALKAWELQRKPDEANLTSNAFLAPALCRSSSLISVGVVAWSGLLSNVDERLADLQLKIDNIAFPLYEISDSDREAIQHTFSASRQVVDSDEVESEESEENDLSTCSEPDALVSELSDYFIGTAFGRWDIRYATGERQPPELPDPFDPLPVCPPGMLQNAEGLPAEPKDVPADYPLRISWPGILVDDENHPEDIVARVREAIEVIWKDRAEAIEQEACGILGVKTLRDYFRRPAAFFADHLKRYSKSRRQAPIYWPLSTKSGSYTLWLYYHRLSNDTLYAAVTQFVEPRIEEAKRAHARLHEKGDARSKLEDKTYEETTQLIGELATFREELLRIAGFWKPNLNDGVLITAAPLWSLFALNTWQKKLKETWQDLEKGKYDWAHLAYSIWPERVAKGCEKDRSIAIAHGLEHLCKVEPPKAKKKAKGKAVVEEDEVDSELIGED